MLAITGIALIPTIGIFLASPLIASLARYGEIVWLENRQPRLKELFSLPLAHYVRVGVVWASVFAIISAILLLYIKSKIEDIPHTKPFAFPEYLMPLGVAVLIGAVAYFFLHSYPFLITKQSQEVLPALRHSTQLSLSYPRHALILTILAMTLNTAGLLLCGVGTLVTVPITFIATAGAHLEILSRAKQK